MMQKKLFLILIAFSFLYACKKGSGQGGTSTIRGKVYQFNYTANFSEKLDSLYSKKENVYIIYGDEVTFGDKTETNYDGTYEFKYLRKGKYKVFAYSKDSAKYPNAVIIPVIITDEITKNKQTIENSDLVIVK